jgi:hypothetical protein
MIRSNPILATRRGFIRSAAAAATAAGLSAAAGGQNQRPPGMPAPAPAELGPPPRPASEIQVPKMRFGNAEISRLIVGCNPFYGFAHFNNTLAAIMREYYTPERVCEVLHQCNRFGINTYNYVHLGRAPQDLQRFMAEGGKMHLIVQGTGDVDAVCRLFKPLAAYHHGELTDRAYQEGRMKEVREWCKKARDLGVLVGVGTHKPEVLALVEEEGWDVDFYAGCVYNRTRTEDEWRKILNGELPEMPREIYLRSDPPRMYKVMSQTAKPCFAFKIMAAGRIDARGADEAFRTAFESIKPTDGVFIGLFPRFQDEVRENAERVHKILLGT